MVVPGERLRRTHGLRPVAGWSSLHTLQFMRHAQFSRSLECGNAALDSGRQGQPWQVWAWFRIAGVALAGLSGDVLTETAMALTHTASPPMYLW